MSVNDAIEIVKELNWEGRVAVFEAFCVHCGGDDPRCQCSNDE